MNLLNLISALSSLITKVLGFTTKLPKPARRAFYVAALVVGILAIVAVFDPSVVSFLGISAKVRGGIVGVILSVLAAIARGNSGDALITELEDAATEVALAESNASRGSDGPVSLVTVAEDVAKAVEPTAVAAVEAAVPAVTPVVAAVLPTVESATAQAPAAPGAI